MAWYIYVILALVAVIAIGAAIMVPILRKKGINPATVYKRSAEVLGDVDSAVDSLASSFPEYPALIKLGYILDYCKMAVKVAEKRYLEKEISGEARKTVAKKYVMDLLKEADVPVTEVMDEIITDTIKGAVTDLPATTPQLSPEPVPVESPPAEPAPQEDSFHG